MMAIDGQHWLKEARRVDSPNHNIRPGGIADISLIVVHCISLPEGFYGGVAIEQLFCNQLDCQSLAEFVPLKGLQVSAHVLIRRCGELVQFVPFDRRAWHAGASRYQGRENCNDFSIGIELEGVDDAPFEQVQYKQLARVCALLGHAYPGFDSSLPATTGHSDIAVPAGRKSDPGSGFDWQIFRTMLNNVSC